MRNDGAEDIFWVRLTNAATDEVLKETTRTTLEEPKGLWTSPMYITLTQHTVFHARIEFGHLENGTKVVDDTESFYILYSRIKQPPPVRHLLTITTTPGNCRVELYDGSDDFIFYVITSSIGFTDPILFREGTYTVKVTKDGYNDWSTTFNLNMDRVWSIALKEEGFWDWIIGFVLEGFEGLLGWTKGSLLTLLGNVKDLITNFFGDIYKFFTNIIGDAWDAVTKFFGDIADFVSNKFMGFVDFVNDLVGDAWDNIKKFFGDIADFVSDKFMGFVDWLGEIGGSIADYIGGAISDFVDWTADQLGSIWEGVTSFFLDAIQGFIDAFFGGVETGIEEAKESPLHSDEPVRNPVTRGLIKVVREHRKKYNKDEITGADKYGRI